jgi:membrane-associated phospholipid phosphatase
MDWLASIDLAGFRFVNQTLSNPVFDQLMPFLSGTAASRLLLALVVLGLMIRGGFRGRMFLACVVAGLLVSDSLVINTIKESVKRPRPFVTHPETILRVGRGSEYRSFPSGHAGNAAMLATVAFLFWRRSARFTVPVAAGVCASRLYLGVHYPSDVFAGAALGTLGGLGVTLSLERLWQKVGQQCFPIWWRRRPSLLTDPKPDPSAPVFQEGSVALDLEWLRLGRLMLVVLLVFRWFYLKAAVIELSEDEAYQWLWSKHLDWSYYSKPLGIAVAQWIGTHLRGDTELGVRFLSPLMAFAIGWMLLKPLARWTSARTSVLFLVAVSATPLLAVGSILITIDPLLVMFWTAAVVWGWRAITEDSTRWWIFTGLASGGVFLSKYSSPFLWASFGIFLLAWPPARAQLRRPGPWLALVVNLICTLPVLLWNQANGWITVRHLSERGGLDSKWQPTAKFLLDFVGAVPALMNPVFFVAIVWAAIAFLRSPNRRNHPQAAILTYLLCFGAPVFLWFFGYTLRARVQPNWIAPSIVPLFLFAAVWWHHQAEPRRRTAGRLLKIGVAIGLPIVVLLHDTNLVEKISGYSLPDRIDPLRRVRGHKALASLVQEERIKFEKAGGKPVFLIADHYGRAGLLSFYTPEARVRIGTDRPLVTVRSSDVPENQFWFWPEHRYAGRAGENALYVLEVDKEQPIPERLLREFDSVSSLGLFNVVERGHHRHRIQLFACRGTH